MLTSLDVNVFEAQHVDRRRMVFALVVVVVSEQFPELIRKCLWVSCGPPVFCVSVFFSVFFRFFLSFFFRLGSFSAVLGVGS